MRDSVHADLREVYGHGFQEIESRLVPTGQDMGYPGARNTERVRKLCLRNVFRIQKLLKAFVHSVILNCYKSNETKVIIQVLQRGLQDE